jgi:hypothetical protein
MYGSWIYKYQCNQYLSYQSCELESHSGGCTRYNIMWYICQWLAAGRWFSSGTPVSSTNITDHHIYVCVSILYFISDRVIRSISTYIHIYNNTNMYLIRYWLMVVIETYRVHKLDIYVFLVRYQNYSTKNRFTANNILPKSNYE